MALKSIRELRKEKGITQNLLASKVGVSPEFITMVEGFKRKANENLLKAVAEALEVDVIDLTIGQLMDYSGIELKDRQAYLNRLSKAFDEDTEKEALKDRDSFGRKIVNKEINRNTLGIKKVVKEKEQSGFGNRNNFGIKRTEKGE